MLARRVKAGEKSQKDDQKGVKDCEGCKGSLVLFTL